MAALVIRNEASGASWRVWPDPDTPPPGAVQETATYLFELSGDDQAGAADLVIDEVRLEALRAPSPREARWRWSPGFHAGVVEAELRLPGQAARQFEILTDPDRRKLSRHNFDTMVREILDDTFALFSLSSFRKGVARGAGAKAPPIARLEFLRSRIEELETVIASIARNPRRLLRGEEVDLPYHRARGVRGPEILKSMRSGLLLRERAGMSRLPAPLRGFLPETIRLARRRSSLDIPEHRQMAAALRSWSAWLSIVSGVLSRGLKESDAEARQGAAIWSARCRTLSRRLAMLASAAPFAEAGAAPARPVLSALFRNDPVYRRFYRLWQDINLGVASIFGDFLNLPLARTYELYELWCFLRLVRASAETFGPEGLEVQDLFMSDARGGVTIAAGAVTVPVGGGWKICFQKQYREFWIEPDGRGTYSRSMTPDVVIANADAASGRVIILDAKYRIDEALNDALSSIHTYRDALVREATIGATEGVVSAAYLLTPHAPHLSAGYRDTPMPGRLFHPEYRSGFRFGAVTLRPGMTGTQIADALRLIVVDATTAAP